MNKIDKGKETEDLVEIVCKIMFLADFTVRNPKYKKASGQEKEAADFLVPFEDHLLAFQVKSKSEIISATERCTKDFDRIRAKIEKGIIQLNTIKRALKANHVLELKNSLGIDIPFASESVKRLVGIVVIDLIGEEFYPPEERTGIFKGFTYHKDIPVHIFLRDNFDVISTEIDTLPDFVEYLDRREFLYSKQILSPLTSELDFLATYKTRPDLIKDCLDGKYNFLLIEDGVWDQYIDTFQENIKERNMLNCPSYLIDNIIGSIHSSIAYTPDVELPSQLNGSLGSINNYWGAVVELSKLNRLQRRVIGEKFLEKAKKANSTGCSYGLAILDKENAVFILSSDKDRQKRVIELYNLAAMAYCGRGLRKILGIATEPLSVNYRSCDTVLLDNIKFENHKELAKKSKTYFGEPQNYHVSEYKDT